MSSLPTSGSLDRRAFLSRAAGASLPLVLAAPLSRRASAQTPDKSSGSGGLIVRQSTPTNLEYPFATLDRFITPNDRFFVRNHFPAPKLDVKTWRLRIEGAVRNPLELTYDDLAKMPARTGTATLECSGNGRGLLVPQVKGVQWALGAVGNAEWTGVPLAALLDKAGVRDTAVDVVLEGADGGPLKEEPKPAGDVRFARSLPLKKGHQPEVLLAHHMNGAVLPENHGYPLRAVVPGWYGVASVKWLTRIVVTERPFQSYYQSIDYAIFERRHGITALVPITEMEVKAEIARPAAGEKVAAGKDYRIFGAAWSGESAVTKVEVSTDGGKTWAAARLLEKPVPHAWRLWEYAWPTPRQPGRYTVMARATDARGRTQPLHRDPDRRNYLISHVLPVAVEVG